MPLDVKDFDGIARLALALNERYGRLDVLVGNAGVLGPLSPLGHVEPKDWDNVIAVNVTANWQLIRCMDPLLKAAPAGRAVFITSAVAHMGARLLGPLCRLQGGARSAGAHLRGGMRDHKRARQSVRPRPDPHPHVFGRLSRRRSETLPAPEEVAKAIVPLCLPDCTESGKIYDFRTGKFLEFRPPA